MKKTIMLALVILMCSAVAAYAQPPARPFYFGVGGTLSLENFDDEDFEIVINNQTQKVDWDNTWGINAKLGYRFNEIIAAQLEYDYIHNYEWDASFDVTTTQGIPPRQVTQRYEISTEVPISTFMLSFKVGPPMGDSPFKPYAIVGGGWMWSDYDINVNQTNQFRVFDDNYSDPCLKAGLGFDIFLNEMFSFGIEGNYNWGFNDLDDIRYINLTAGISLYF